MAKRPITSSIASGYQATDTINNNFENVKTAFDNTLSLDGSAPNAMEADFDLNSNDIINAQNIYAADVIINGLSFQNVLTGAYSLLYPGLGLDFTDNSYLSISSNVGTGTPTANRTVEVTIEGTKYYLLASTTSV